MVIACWACADEAAFGGKAVTRHVGSGEGTGLTVSLFHTLGSGCLISCPVILQRSVVTMKVCVRVWSLLLAAAGAGLSAVDLAASFQLPAPNAFLRHTPLRYPTANPQRLSGVENQGGHFRSVFGDSQRNPGRQCSDSSPLSVSMSTRSRRGTRETRQNHIHTVCWLTAHLLMRS